MKIGIIGAGKVGGTLAELWAKAGHEVKLASRNPTKLAPKLQRLSAGGPGSPEDAAAWGDAVFVAIPYGAWPELAATIGSTLAGKIVMDATNPYPARDGAFAQEVIDAGEGSGLPIARLIPGARLVRAFNGVHWETLGREASRPAPRIGIPLASDDAAAMDIVAALVRDAGFTPVIVGSLINARDFDPGSPVYNKSMDAPTIADILGLPEPTP